MVIYVFYIMSYFTQLIYCSYGYRHLSYYLVTLNIIAFIHRSKYLNFSRITYKQFTLNVIPLSYTYFNFFFLRTYQIKIMFKLLSNFLFIILYVYYINHDLYDQW